MKKYNSKYLIRTCLPFYKDNKFLENDIQIYELIFSDGGVPSDEIIKLWINICDKIFQKDDEIITVHCQAGLGRTMVLIAIYLIEKGMKYYDAIILIRQKRKGSFNNKQINWLKKYKSIKKNNCVIV